MLREGFLAKELTSHVEDWLLPDPSRDSAFGSTIMPAGHPQDYGGFVADTRLVEIVDKALGKDYRAWRATDVCESPRAMDSVAGCIGCRTVMAFCIGHGKLLLHDPPNRDGEHHHSRR